MEPQPGFTSYFDDGYLPERSFMEDMKNILGELLLNNLWCLKTMGGLQSSRPGFQ